ncbi:tyrosine-type recombinase/integrase [Francisella tularensis]|uniref:tyrosine-type recombinase/integrase n=1 Tax=Francisella tularensis TaxID=263 RepID=UPI000173E3B7|nr:tyrosine-type recombinase/integrase [Francisella tularensis]ACD30429.1 site-specific recombinase [Francisella tularensis subsp. mediasiatica FSC147]MBK2077401.1 tyrosine-type recombinase/integrase [Francisella tularensis subsp. mediasiatica]MBK2102289.1 tyrosine-type recombinase/integrase [Francisella tularensis subsp. mediasiatica]MBK2103999.1 tyrosine-type recombinase/integrase [Francisella tularensis subsp. mediasiatica]MDN9002775.1 tyrosine-type recombinase/integrase [Francisella tulare
MTNLEHINNFLDNLLYLKNYSQETINNYQRDLLQLNQALSDKNIISLTHSDILIWIKKLHAQGNSPKTLQRKLSSVRSFFNFLINSEIVSQNPANGIKAPKDSKRLPKVVNTDELAYLLDINPSNDIEARDIACFDLLYSCGIRLSELSSVELKDISISQKNIRVTGKGNKQRIVYFGTKTLSNLSRWLKIRDSLKPSSDYLFISRDGKHLTNRSIQKRLEIFAQKYASRHIHPHMLRHSFASHVLDSSKDLLAVKDLLGHADISSTQIYTHLNFQQLASVFDKAHPRAKKK